MGAKLGRELGAAPEATASAFFGYAPAHVRPTVFGSMNKPLLSAALFLSLAIVLRAGPAMNTLTADEKAAGWKLLFDGKITAGWRAVGKEEFPAVGWTAEDGVFKHTKGGGDIVTTESFENFELSWDWNISEGGNSGLKYILPDPHKGIGFEYQLLDDLKHPDGVKGGRLHQTAGLYDLIEPSMDRKVNPPGQWNTSRLIISGNKVEQWLNGVKTVAFELGSEDLKARIAKSKYKGIPKFGEKTNSPILLQDHGDPIDFRNIKIRVIK